MHSRLNGPLPPRRTRRVQRRRRRFPVYGLITLVLFLCSGMLYARAADVFVEKEKPSQAAEASGDLAAPCRALRIRREFPATKTWN